MKIELLLIILILTNLRFFSQRYYSSAEYIFDISPNAQSVLCSTSEDDIEKIMIKGEPGDTVLFTKDFPEKGIEEALFVGDSSIVVLTRDTLYYKVNIKNNYAIRLDIPHNVFPVRVHADFTNGSIYFVCSSGYKKYSLAVYNLEKDEFLIAKNDFYPGRIIDFVKLDNGKYLCNIDGLLSYMDMRSERVERILYNGKTIDIGESRLSLCRNRRIAAFSIPGGGIYLYNTIKDSVFRLIRDKKLLYPVISPDCKYLIATEWEEGMPSYRKVEIGGIEKK